MGFQQERESQQHDQTVANVSELKGNQSLVLKDTNKVYQPVPKEIHGFNMLDIQIHFALA